MTAKVEIYGTSFCRHCVDARAFLDAKGIEYESHLFDLMPLEKDTMIERCGQKSIPQIFINDKHIGGFDDLKALDSRGELDAMLNSECIKK
ncbi:Glutaredoxin 3 [Nymphon striatum]|nr:Glutaredoxin 3 [Nymphon striatum]